MSSRSEESFPRVLLVADSAIGDTSGTGITLANMFANWPVDRIAQVHGRPQSQSPSFPDVPSMQVDKTLVPGYVQAARLRARARARVKGVPTTTARRPADGAAGLLPPPKVRKGWQTAWFDLIPLRTRSQLNDFVSVFRPDVIVTMAGSVRIMRLAATASRLSGAPVVPHFMDDWPSTLYRGSVTTLVPRMVLGRALRTMMGRSPRGLAISPAMVDEYTARFGVPFMHMGNLVSVGGGTPSRGAIRRSDRLSLGYVGGLHLGREQTLWALARVIEVHPEWSLTIVSPGNGERAEQPEWCGLMSTHLAPAVAAEEVVETVAGFDALVHVESFDAQQRRYTRLSLSTKIAQYLSVGRPVLAIGPDEIASMAYLAQSQAGVVVSTTRESDLAAALTALADSGARSRMAESAIARAKEDFDVANGTERLRTWLQLASGGSACSA